MTNRPIITTDFSADPSAHVFDGRIYIYPSHDVDAGVPENDNGDHFAMSDYHVYSQPDPTGPVTDHGVVLRAQDVPWVSKQLWAPDAACSGGRYYLYFPARDKQGVFRIGVAAGDAPEGPFRADPEPIPGSYSIDPACFVDDDGRAYLYFGGIWGGQLQCWREDGSFDGALQGPQEPRGEGVPALLPRVAVMGTDMRSFEGEVRGVRIVDGEGALLAADDHDRRFFEAAWVHKYDGTYYFSYSTGDTHFIAYATGESPLGPFTYRGRVLEPVLGWTTHHSIVEFEGRWYIYHHDTSLSGKTHLRSVKVREIFYDKEGKIHTSPQV